MNYIHQYGDSPLFAIAMAMLLAISCTAGNGKQDRALEATDTICDFGLIREDSVLPAHRFWIRNLEKRNLVILQVIPSCPCMSEAHSRDIAANGDSLWVDVTFDTNDYVGAFEKTVKVKTTLGEVQLSIKGVVIDGTEGHD